MGSVIELQDISKRYAANGRPAVDAVTMAIDAGRITAVMGPSGSGKSTLLNLIGGLDRPSAGSVLVDGVRVDRLGESAAARYRREKVGLIFQFFHLLDDLSVFENVLLPAHLAGMDRRLARARAGQLLEQLRIVELMPKLSATLSGGERQRVAIARALINHPAVLLADEPTGALDTRNGDEVIRMLEELAESGQTIVLVTHDPRLAARCAARTVELVDGAIAHDTDNDRVA